MTNLPIEDQKLLTKALGECWHEEKFYKRAGYRSTEVCCKKCGIHMGGGSVYRLDFTDWRVVGRLIENIGQIHLNTESRIGDKPIFWAWIELGGRHYSAKAYSIQLAVCLAIAAWLKEKQHD